MQDEDRLSWQILTMYLELVPGANCYVNGKECKAYRRVHCTEWASLQTGVRWHPAEDIVLEDEHYDLVQRATEQHNPQHDFDTGRSTWYILIQSRS